MNYCSFDLGHFNLFCPATGEIICGPNEVNEKAKSLRGFWIGDVLEEPTIPDAKLRSAWRKAVKEADGADSLMLERFLRGYAAPTWCAFAITTSGMACGPVSSTAWFVLDLDVEIETETSRRKATRK
jgi:hypothetical protein